MTATCVELHNFKGLCVIRLGGGLLETSLSTLHGMCLNLCKLQIISQSSTILGTYKGPGSFYSAHQTCKLKLEFKLRVATVMSDTHMVATFKLLSSMCVGFPYSHV